MCREYWPLHIVFPAKLQAFPHIRVRQPAAVAAASDDHRYSLFVAMRDFALGLPKPWR
jgi:hypothetical protein